MSDDNIPQAPKPKKKRSRAVSGLFKRACRRGLLERVGPDGDERWVDKVVSNVKSMAATERSALGLQAVMILIEQTQDEFTRTTVESRDDQRSENSRLRNMSDEEVDAEIAAITAEIKEIDREIGEDTQA